MYTQYQKGLSVVLLTSILLQSCAGDNTNIGNYQYQTEERESKEDRTTAPRPAPPPEMPISPPRTNTSIQDRINRSNQKQNNRKNVDDKKTQNHSTTHNHSMQDKKPEYDPVDRDAWQAHFQKKITELGKKQPRKATLISQRLIRGYQGEATQKQALAELGVPPPPLPRILGGMIKDDSEDEIHLPRVPIDLLATGSKKEMERRRDDRLVPAQIQLMNGELIQGHHEGARILSEPQRRGVLRAKQYHLLAHGPGTFFAERISYRGAFLNSMFHDLTGQAEYIIDQQVRYRGNFSQGKREGTGTLELFDPQRRDYFIHYQGTWRDDHPDTGTFFSPEGHPNSSIENGQPNDIAVAVAHVDIAPLPSERGAGAASPELPPTPARETSKLPSAPSSPYQDVALSLSHGAASTQTAHYSPADNAMTSPYTDDALSRSQGTASPQTALYSPADNAMTSPYTDAALSRSQGTASPQTALYSPAYTTMTSPYKDTAISHTQKHKRLQPERHSRQLSTPTEALDSSLDPQIAPEMACPLIAQKLSNPQLELSLDQSIELLTTCVGYGQMRAQKMTDQEAVIVLGNTGAGKSTLVNYLTGCTMTLKSPRELGLKGLDKIVVVQPRHEGGDIEELTPIGHKKESKTFIPQIETAPDGTTYCDCPGFLDNRGPEINIANAVNVRAALAQARSVKVIVLINYHSLRADRGRGLADLIKMVTDMFGDVEKVRQHAPSLLFGISQVPLDMEVEVLRDWLLEEAPPVMHTLVERLFLFDPLDRPLEGAWNRAECLRQLASLPPITHPDSIFRTMLSDSDQQKLIELSEGLGRRITAALEENKWVLVEQEISHLERLRLIEHPSVERLIAQAQGSVERHFQRKADLFRDHCLFERFEEAESLLAELQSGKDALGRRIDGAFELSALNSLKVDALDRHQARLDKEEKAKEGLQEAHGQIKTLREQIEAREQHLRTELTAQLAQKEQELRTAHAIDYEKAQARLEQEKAALRQDYASKLQQALEEKECLLREQQAAQARREQELRVQQAALTERFHTSGSPRMPSLDPALTLDAPLPMETGQNQLERYLRGMESNNAEVRNKASQLLSELALSAPSEAMRDRLLKATTDIDPNVCVGSLKALEVLVKGAPHLAHESVYSSLVQAMGHTEVSLVLAALEAMIELIKAMPRLVDVSLRNMLLRTVSSREGNVRSQARATLVSLVRVAPQLSTKAVYVALVQATEDSQASVCKAAKAALMEHANANPSESMREGLLRSAGRSQARATLAELVNVAPHLATQAVYEVLIQATGDSQEGVRKVASATLLEQAKTNPSEMLREELLGSGGNSQARATLAELVNVAPHLATQAVYEVLIQATGDSQANVRKAASDTLIEQARANPSEGLAKILLRVIEENNKPVPRRDYYDRRNEQEVALEEASRTQICSSARATVAELINVAPQLANQAVYEALVQAAGDRQESVRKAARETLLAQATFNPGEALVLPLITALGNLLEPDKTASNHTVHAPHRGSSVQPTSPSTMSPDTASAQETVEMALKELVRANANEELRETLLRATKDDNERNRSAAHATLVELISVAPQLANQAVYEVLMQAAGDRQASVRKAASDTLLAQATGNPGDHLLLSLIAALGNRNTDIHLTARATLLELVRAAPQEAVMMTLIQASGRANASARSAIVTGLGELVRNNPNEDMRQALILAGSDSNKYVGSNARFALASLIWARPQLANPPTMEVLFQAMGDDEEGVRSATCVALGQMLQAADAELPLQAVLEVIVQTAGDSQESVRNTAREVLIEQAKTMPSEAMCQALLLAMRDSNEHRRSTASTALGQLVQAAPGLATPAVLEALVQTAGDSQESVRKAAHLTLVEFVKAAPSETVCEVLMRMVRDRSEYIRVAVIEALGELVNTTPTLVNRAVPTALLRALRDRDEHVRSAACTALGNLASSAPSIVDKSMLTALMSTSKDAQEAVTRAGGRALGEVIKVTPQHSRSVLKGLLKGVQDNNGRVRSSSRLALGELVRAAPEHAESVWESLVHATRDRNKDVRSAASEALVELAKAAPHLVNEAVRSALVAAARYRNEYVRSAAIAALVELAKAAPHLVNGAVRSALVAAARDRNEYVRSAAIAALGELAKAAPHLVNEAVLSALVAAAGDSDPNVRRAASEALSELAKAVPSEEVLGALLSAAGDSSWFVRSAASALLSELVQAAPHLASEEVFAPLIQAAGGGTWPSALTKLGQLVQRVPQHAEAVLSALVAAARDSEWSVRSAAIAALVELAKAAPHLVNEAVLPALVAAAWDSIEFVSSAAIAALVELAEVAPQHAEAVRSAMVAAARDRNGYVRHGASKALVELAKAAPHLVNEAFLPALVTAARDSERSVRSAAIAALVELAKAAPHLVNEAVLRALVGAARDSNWSVRSDAIAALVELAEVAPQHAEAVRSAMVAATRNPNWYVRHSASAALVMLAKAAPHLVNEAVLPALVAAAGDEDAWVRSAANEAMRELVRVRPDLNNEQVRASLR
ncbi:MAG: sister chromatid cohesion protein PDS5 [Roseivirga sp.]